MSIFILVLAGLAFAQDSTPRPPPATPSAKSAVVTISSDGSVTATVPCNTVLGLGGTSCMDAAGRLVVAGATARAMDRDNTVTAAQDGRSQTVTSAVPAQTVLSYDAQGRPIYSSVNPVYPGQASGGGSMPYRGPTVVTGSGYTSYGTVVPGYDMMPRYGAAPGTVVTASTTPTTTAVDARLAAVELENARQWRVLDTEASK